MNRRRRSSLRRNQPGFMLIALLALLAMGGLYFLISNLTPEAIEARRQAKTETALVRAQEALIGYALRYREDQINDGQLDRVYGYLPLPDLGYSANAANDRNNNTGCAGEGCDAANAKPPGSIALNYTVIGRYPWRLLGTEPLRDGNGECLWYAVSGSHQRQQRISPMNWDTPGQLDLVTADSSSNIVAANLTPHERPVAIIFSPGPSSSSRNTSATADVTECGGNYTVSDYLDVTNLGPIFSTTNQASGNTSTQPKPLSTRGKILASAGASLPNDIGLAITGDMLFGALRKSSLFRLDINSMLDRMSDCVRDRIAAGSNIAAAKIQSHACYDDTKDPQGYFSHYRDQVFVASGAFSGTVDNLSAPSCSGALIFAGQRQTGQQRSTTPEKATVSNYLESPNVSIFDGGGSLVFSGHGQFKSLASGQTAYQDIVRCIPAGASMVAAPSALPAGSELSQYDPATRTLTLGRQNVESDQGYAASTLFGCAWTPEARATGSGFRSYFRFNISDAGDGFVFAAVDGDRNGTTVCGAGEQHLGYSGANGYTTPIAYPKLGLEFDTRRNFRSKPPYVPDGFDPTRIINASTLRTLANGRADPDYSGGHIGLVYWGGESFISTDYACGGGGFCRSPSFCDTDNICKLNQEEDDNVHGQLPTSPALRPPPRNPPLPPPATPVGTSPTAPPSPPPYPPYGVDKLDPSLSSVPTDQDIHVRVEVARSAYAGRDDNSRLVRAVATVNLVALSGLPGIDGITLQPGDTVLVTGQTDAKTNGLYIAAAGDWTRATNADEAADLPPGTSWFIKEGTIHRGSLWRLQNTEVPIINSSALVISRFREPVKAVATTNLALAGLQTVGGVLLAAGDRILLTGQTDSKQNGVYSASAGAWSRAAFESTSAGMKDGATWFATSGAGSYWRLAGDATPGTSNITIGAISFPSNNIYSATVTTQVWKLTSNVTTPQIARMKTTTRSMNQLDPVVRYDKCPLGTCPASNPDGQSCGGVETDGFRYCYTGQKPNLYDSKKIFDIRGTTSCGSNVSCTGNQFCGIDNVCYQPAFRTTRLGFTDSQSTQSQAISISDFFTTWLP